MINTKKPEIKKQAQSFHILYKELEGISLNQMNKIIDSLEDEDEREFLFQVQEHFLAKKQREVINAPFDI